MTKELAKDKGKNHVNSENYINTSLTCVYN